MARARHYSQLVSWQLADALRVVTFRSTRRAPFLKDFKHRSHRQKTRSIPSAGTSRKDSVCISHAEFARYLEISRRSSERALRLPAQRAAQGVCHGKGSCGRPPPHATALSRAEQFHRLLETKSDRSPKMPIRDTADDNHRVAFRRHSWIAFRRTAVNFLAVARARNDAR